MCMMIMVVFISVLYYMLECNLCFCCWEMERCTTLNYRLGEDQPHHRNNRCSFTSLFIFFKLLESCEFIDKKIVFLLQSVNVPAIFIFSTVFSRRKTLPPPPRQMIARREKRTTHTVNPFFKIGLTGSTSGCNNNMHASKRLVLQREKNKEKCLAVMNM